MVLNWLQYEYCIIYSKDFFEFLSKKKDRYRSFLKNLLVLNNLFYFVTLQTRRTYFNGLNLSVNLRFHFMEIRIKFPLRRVQSVTSMITNLCSLSTDITNF